MDSLGMMVIHSPRIIVNYCCKLFVFTAIRFFSFFFFPHNCGIMVHLSEKTLMSSYFFSISQVVALSFSYLHGHWIQCVVHRKGRTMLVKFNLEAILLKLWNVGMLFKTPLYTELIA